MSGAAASGRDKVRRRLDGSWKMELGNVLLMPAFLYYVTGGSWVPSPGLGAFCLVPMCGLLLVGGWCWRAKARAAAGDRSALPGALALARRAQMSLLLLTIAAAGASLTDLLVTPLAAGTGDRVLAALAAGLAVLEYVNYYHRQLQHFDNPADVRRLLRGEGFRESHLRADLNRAG